MHGTEAWYNLRKRTIARDGGRCRKCSVRVVSGRKHKHSAAIDHIEPHRGDRVKFFDPDNVWLLCKSCHDGWKARTERGKKMQRADGW